MVGHRLHEREPEELPRDDVGADAAHERLKAQPLVVRRPGADAGVQHHEARDPLRVLDREAKADRAAPVLHDERDRAKIELRHESRDRLDMTVVGVEARFGRLVGAAEAEVVGRDTAGRADELRDDLPVEECPRRFSMEEQDGVAGALVDVVHPQAVLLQVPRLVGVTGQIAEALVGRAIHAHGRHLIRG